MFHHVRKTAGTSLKRTIERNVPGGSTLRVLYPDGPGAEVRGWWEELFTAMTPAEQATLAAVSSHTAGYCLDLLPGPAIALTMVRDPIDQALSRWFMRTKKRAGDPLESNLDRLREQYERGASKEDWYNPQARTLLEPHFDVSELAYTLGPPPDANVWRARLFSLLSQRFVVGTQDAYEDSVQRFAEELGWTEMEEATDKVNPYRPRSYPLDTDLANVMLAANWLDVELHGEYARTFGRRPADPGRATGRPTPRGRGYVLGTPPSDDPVADMRAEFEDIRDQLAREAQSLRLRLRAVELELHHTRAGFREQHAAARPKKQKELPESSPPADARAAADRRRKDKAHRATIKRMRSA